MYRKDEENDKIDEFLITTSAWSTAVTFVLSLFVIFVNLVDVGQAERISLFFIGKASMGAIVAVAIVLVFWTSDAPRPSSLPMLVFGLAVTTLCFIAAIWSFF